MSTPADGKPPLASLVLAGDQQTEAERITDFIFMAKDISNAYLVTTADGDVQVNTGFMDNAARTKALLTSRRTGPLRKIILTQAHPDHYGGVPLMKEPGTEVIAERRFVDTWRYFRDLGPYLGRRSAKLWAARSNVKPIRLHRPRSYPTSSLIGATNSNRVAGASR